ncbi:acetyltransferase [Porphyrobacter sp. HT-58-2]|uniref:NeuD/PglB/VioB family sugar acetyltransferase n=1 Tax=Porphyrobacter sp. HT-58-2 TaxID=2023229 RepID=UPI000CDC7FFD|nr:NeuD/PglB/VioB family sugar acetyltransferase [Porphyrobacter sp. HT-58-2]AUX69627.1 acetyltransferase [Porphyrobacter sp. HT-58-2]
MTKLIGIYGASGFGREVMAVARLQCAEQGAELVFIDDSLAAAMSNGHQVVTFTDFCSLPADERLVTIAIADAKVREKLAGRCREAGVSQFDICAANVFVGDEVKAGEGAILQPFVCLTGNISIGRCFHANIYSYVAHDCEIGDFVTFAPGVKCNGNVHIHDHAYIGTGAILRQGTPEKPLTIGAGAVIGMGAVVTKDVAPGVTVVGNPARPLVKE